MIKSLAHVCLSVRDLDVAEAFYVGKLGLRLAFDFRNEQGRRVGLYLHVGQRSFVELFLATPEMDPRAGTYRHLCLEVDDINAAVGVLRGHGLTVSDPLLGCDQSWQAWLQDPDGNDIELHQYTAESWQAGHLA